MKILVTGSNGCVGSALKNLCCDERDWVFIERKDCDLTDREKTLAIFNSIQPDYVIHLASYVPGFYQIDRVASFATNVRINENVLEAANAVNVERGIFCLSVNMFPESPSRFPMDESMIFDGELTGPFAGYAYSKRMLAMQYRNYNIQYGRKYFGIIPSNIYGPNDNITSGRLIPNLISRFEQAIKDNSDIMINGSGKPLRQFIYSKDLAKIIKHLVINYSGVEDIICCDGMEVSIAELVNIIGRIMNFTNKIKFDTDKPDGVFKKTVSDSRLKKIIDFPLTSLESGLGEILGAL